MTVPRRNNSEAASVADIKNAVRERDGYCCTACGITNDEHVARRGSQLEVHRVVPGSYYTISGSRTLCIACHAKEPRRKRGTPDLGDPVRNRYQSVNIPADTLKRLRVLAYHRGIHIRDLVDSILKPVADAAYRQMAEDIKNASKGNK